MNKIEYLKKYLPKCNLTCNHSKETLCGACFTNNIILPYNNIPVCTRCKDDTQKFRKELDRMKNRPNDVLEFKIDCTKYCLWYEWFHMRRSEFANNIEFKYVRK